MSGVRVSHLGPENRKNCQKWRFFCVLGSVILGLDPQCFFDVGQDSSNGAGFSPAPFLLSTHILTHNTAIHNGQDKIFVGRKVADGLSFDVVALSMIQKSSIIIILNVVEAARLYDKQ